MLKVNNKDTRTTPYADKVSLQSEKVIPVKEIDIEMHSLMKPLHVEWIIDFYQIFYKQMKSSAFKKIIESGRVSASVYEMQYVCIYVTDLQLIPSIDSQW